MQGRFVVAVPTHHTGAGKDRGSFRALKSRTMQRIRVLLEHLTASVLVLVYRVSLISSVPNGFGYRCRFIG